MLIAVLIGAAAVWHADHRLTVQDPPPVSAEPVLSLVLSPGRRLSWAKTSEYQVVESFRRCQNPVTVVLDALINGAQIPGPTTAPTGYAHGELVDPLGVPGKIKLLEDPFSGWVVPRHEFVQHPGRHTLLFGAPLRQWYPSVVQYGMAPAATERAVLVELRFQENWVLPRSTGTCYVRFPTLQAPLYDPTELPNAAAWPPAAGPGEVSVVSKTGDLADWQTSIPPPTDPRIPQWRCTSMAPSQVAQYSAAKCGGVAVFSVPGADSHVALWLLIDGALIGVAAALFVETAKEFRGPPRLRSAQPIAYDATGGESDPDAAAGSGTSDRRGRPQRAASAAPPSEPGDQGSREGRRPPPGPP